MIILEPEMCRYVCVLYHPSVCQVNGMGLRGLNSDESEYDELYDLMEEEEHEE